MTGDNDKRPPSLDDLRENVSIKGGADDRPPIAEFYLEIDESLDGDGDDKATIKLQLETADIIEPDAPEASGYTASGTSNHGKPTAKPMGDPSVDGGGSGVQRVGPPVLPSGCPVTPIGVREDAYFYLDPAGQVRELKDQEHTRLRIQGLFGDRQRWLWDHFPRRNKEGVVVSFAAEDAAAALMDAAYRRGIGNPRRKIRGRGVWLGDNFELVVHCGDVIYAGGREQAPGFIGSHVYPAAEASLRPSSTPAVAGETGPAARLLRYFGTWTWKRGEIDAYLLLGFAVAALCAGALNWRPHIWVTGDKGTGKSTLHTFLRRLCDDSVVWSSNATAAGIWQDLGHDALPVIIDEAEARDDNRQMQSIMELARQASGGGRILRGGQDHLGREFGAVSCFLFSAINVPPLSPQDRSRTPVLELEKLTSEEDLDVERLELPAIGASLLRRLVDCWPRMNEFLDVWRNAMREAGHDKRGIDVYGTLLACADLVLHDHLPSQDEIEERKEALAANKLAELYDDAPDHERCLEHLMTTPLTATLETRPGSQQRTVGQWIEMADGWRDGQGKRLLSRVPDDEAARVIGNIGLKIHSETDDQGDERRYLAVANAHHGLAQIFSGTKWRAESGSTGGWRQALRRFDGARVHKPLRIGAAKPRCILLPLEVVLPDDDA